MKNLKLLTGLCLILGVTIATKDKNETRLKTEMLLSNIEALANNEDIVSVDHCYLDGSVKCPAGGYSVYQILNINRNIWNK